MYDPDGSFFDLDADKPLVLLLGNIAHEGVLSILQASDRQYKQKLLKSKPENWQSIIEYFDHFEITSVLIKLSPDAISRMASEEYENVSLTLMERISEKPNMVFVYEDLLSRNIKTENEDWREYYNQPNEEELDRVLNRLESLELDLMPYKSNAQVTVLADSFLQGTEQNLLLRLYLPSGRMWSKEMDRLLQLFREYLSNVMHVSTRLDQHRTDKGIIYEFHGDEPRDKYALGVDFSEFTRFLDLCVSDQSAAEEMLVGKQIDRKRLSEILSRYAKESKRLHIDFKHERERKILNIRQRLESELVDAVVGDTPWREIDAIVQSRVPSVVGSGALLAFEHSSGSDVASTPKSPVTINLNPQIIETVNGIVAHEINGDQDLGVHGQELLELVNKYEKTSELTSAVYELEDESAPKPARLKAKQKIKKFLLGMTRRGTDVAVGVLQSYIESKFGL